jgi:hypothetical protein
MAIQRFKLALNSARFPLISRFQSRPTVVPGLDTSQRNSYRTEGSDENIDNNAAQIIYGENFVPVAGGVKSVSYHTRVAATGNTDFDQIFPLRDANENTVLYSPGKGQNYTYAAPGPWMFNTIANILGANVPAYVVAENTVNTPATAKVTRAYVDGKTFVCYSKLGARLTTDPVGPVTKDASLYFWDGATFWPVGYAHAAANLITNLPIALSAIDGISSSNGYLLIWSGLSVYWAPFNGTSFNFAAYASGEVTGAGTQIPEDIQGPITAIIPMSGGYIIFTTKNAVAAQYNANNFASPWIFKSVSNAGGIESFEQAASEGGLGALYAYTTGGMQKISLNAADVEFPDVADFLGGRLLETFDLDTKAFTVATLPTEFYTKITQCGNRFLVISYGTFPGVYAFALVYDTELKRWGKLNITHADCFGYQYGSETIDITYGMLVGISYAEMLAMTYGTAQIQGGGLTYPRQSIAFLLKTGEIKTAIMDERAPEGTSNSFVIIGKNQLMRARMSTLHLVEVEGLSAGGLVWDHRSVDGKILETPPEIGTLREQTDDYSEWGFDMPTGKNHTIGIQGQFHLSTLIFHATNDGSI